MCAVRTDNVDHMVKSVDFQHCRSSIRDEEALLSVCGGARQIQNVHTVYSRQHIVDQLAAQG